MHTIERDLVRTPETTGVNGAATGEACGVVRETGVLMRTVASICAINYVFIKMETYLRAGLGDGWGRVLRNLQS